MFDESETGEVFYHNSEHNSEIIFSFNCEEKSFQIDSSFTTGFIIHSNILARFPEDIKATFSPDFEDKFILPTIYQMKTARPCISYVTFYGPLSRTGHFRSRLVNREFTRSRVYM